MGFLETIPIIGTVIEKIFGVIDKAVENKDEANKLKVSIQTQLLQQDYQEIQTQIEKQASIIVAEAQGQSWLQRNWRPGLMALFGLIIANNFVIFPYLELYGVKSTSLQIPPDMWALLKLGIGGYVVGRSGEKIAGQIYDMWTQKGASK